MQLERTEFITWMERIMARLDVLGEKVYKMELRRQIVDGEELLDNQELMEMLKISPRSLQRYRSSGQLPYFTISGKLYYKTSDVHAFVRECFGRRTRKKKGNTKKEDK